MHAEQRQKTHALLQKKHIHQALFARSETVKWLTGFTPPVQTGLNLFASGNALVWYDDGHFTLIVLDAYGEIAAPFQQEVDGEVVTYEGYAIEQPIASARNLLAVLERAFSKRTSSKIGVEMEFVSALVVAQLSDSVNDLTAIDGWLEPLRAVKTLEELAKLRRSFALADIGHTAAREATYAGQREIDVWNSLHSAIQGAVGVRVPVGNDCVSGRRASNIGGYPANIELHEHDSLIVDISAIHDGYWSDSCATYYAGERTSKQAKIHNTIQNALDYAVSMIKPGVIAKEVDQKVRQFMVDAGYPVYPHHTGHGVGASGHEAPRIVPYSDEVLQEGMVIMLEPGIYFPGETGVRLEDGMLIVSDGVEILTHHDKT